MRHAVVLMLFLTLALPAARASSSLPLTLDQRFAAADAVCAGTVARVTCFADPSTGLPCTETLITVTETLKGSFREQVRLSHRGGQVGRKILVEDGSPRFVIDQERLLFLHQLPDGTVQAAEGDADAPLLFRKADGSWSDDAQTLLDDTRACAARTRDPGRDLTRQSASRLPASGSGNQPRLIPGLTGYPTVPARFLAPDRGQPIPCIIDMQALPAGITTNQALNAVSNACQAWSAVSSATFAITRVTNFGIASPNYNVEDGAIHIQLHDLFNYITTPGVLGKGGQAATYTYFAGGGEGGRIGTQEFYYVTHAFVVLKHTNSALQNITNLTEVLAHEIGHALGFAHSFEAPSANPILTNALMYYTAHLDGRGALLALYDTNIISYVHPLNTAPWTFSRFLDVVTSPFGVNVPGVNSVELRGYDLQGGSLSLLTANGSSPNGTFTLSGSVLSFTPGAGVVNFVASNGDLFRFSPGDTSDSAYDTRFFRVSDGTNASPWCIVRVISYRGDSAPSFPADGLPNQWMTNYFGNISPTAGPGRLASDDFDGDGASNLREYLDGTSPVNANSVLSVTSVTPTSLTCRTTPFLVYQVQQSSNLTSWTRLPRSFLATNTTTAVPLPATGPNAFFRVERVP